MVDELCAKLNEHFDSVLILTTRPYPDNPGDTESYARIGGNFFAAFGKAEEWVIMKKQQMKTHADIEQRKYENDDSL